MPRRFAIAALGLLLAAASPVAALAADDGPVATAEANGAPGFTLDDQIEAWRADGEAAAAPDVALLPGSLPGRDRQVHGMVSVGVGTGGYRSVYAQTTMPIGSTGTLDVAIGDERGRFGRGGPTLHNRSLSIGLSFDATQRSVCGELSAVGPKDAPWRRYDDSDRRAQQAACDAGRP